MLIVLTEKRIDYFRFLLNLIIADAVSLVILFPSVLASFIQYSVAQQKLEDDFSSMSSSSALHASAVAPGTDSNYAVGHSNTTVVDNYISYEDQDQTVYWKLSCALNKGLISGVATASVLATFEIAVERYLAVVTPLHYHKFLTTTSIFVVSLISGVISLGELLTMCRRHDHNDQFT
jgi:hypothetical protein